MSNQSRVIALGFFDGVHLGHGALLHRAAEEAKARGVRSAVFTFAQPPKEVVTGVPVPLINSPEDRAWLATITNTATVTGNGFDQTAQETIAMEPRADLSISKALCPVTVTENGQLTYTFVIENAGSVAAAAADNVVLTDTFDPKLNSIAVTFNGTPWSEGVNYTYDTTTGLFQTLPGQITVPAATYTQKADGTWSVTPGVAVLTVTGTV